MIRSSLSISFHCNYISSVIQAFHMQLSVNGAQFGVSPQWWHSDLEEWSRSKSHSSVFIKEELSSKCRWWASSMTSDCAELHEKMSYYVSQHRNTTTAAIITTNCCQRLIVLYMFIIMWGTEATQKVHPSRKSVHRQRCCRFRRVFSVTGVL